MVAWLVTGANRGIGLGLVRRLLERGETVIATARDPGDAPDLQALAGSGRLTILAMDVTDPATITRAGASVQGVPVSVLVNNAGIYGPMAHGAFELDADAFAHTLAVNTVGPFRVLQAFRPNLTAAGGGAKAIFISSTMGSITSASSGYLAYRASKAALNKAVQAAAGDLARQGITAIVMHPGWVRTRMGGPSATLSVEDATAGIVRTIDRLGSRDAGAFLEWDGRAAAW